MIVGIVLVFDPELLVSQVDFGTVPTVGDFLIAIPVAMVAYTGIETISNMAEEARDYGKTIPRGIGLVVGAVAVIYTFLPAVALSAMPVKNGVTVLALPKEEGGYADDPVLGVVKNMDLGSLEHPAEIYVGILAATILFIATNAGILGVSRLSYSMGQHRQLPEFLRVLHPRFRTPYIAIAVFSAIACIAIMPGEADFLGVIYAFGAMLSFTMAHVGRGHAAGQTAGRRTAVEGAVQPPMRGYELPMFAILGGLGTGIALIVATVLDLRVLVSGVRLDGGRRSPSTWSTAAARACRSPRPTRSCRRSRRSSTRWSTSRSSWRSRTALLAGGGLHGGPARRPPPPRHPRARDDHRAAELADRRRHARAGGEGLVGDRLGPRARRPPRDRPLGEGAPRPGGASRGRGGEGDPGARHRDAAAAAAHRGVALRAYA